MQSEHDLRTVSQIQTPPGSVPVSASVASARSHPAEIGHFRILGVLGEGGFGVVYLAEQQEPVRRRVALKVIKPGMDSHAVVARFRAEQQALAMMVHPCVAKVFDGGETPDGRPYFVMEHVQGLPITDHCNRHRLDLEERIKLFIRVCEAVQHAHTKGVIHRDIKPSNILVEYQDGRATPKVIDFGVAKALHQKLSDATIYTEQGQFIGTPEYMSPEQAEMSAVGIDTRSDIYSLGVILYELVTGRRPFESEKLRTAGYAEIQRIIREVDPPKPSTRLSTLIQGGDPELAAHIAQSCRLDPKGLSRRLKGDLDWVIMKCLEKDRERRYDTASALSMELQRYLAHEPVLAGPPSASYRVSKFVRRHRAGVLAGTCIAAALCAATIVSIFFAVLAKNKERDAVRATEDLRLVTDFQSRMLSRINPRDLGQAAFQLTRAEIANRLAQQKLDQAEIDAALARFDEATAQANPTDVAQRLLDEQILSRAIDTITKEFEDRPVTSAALRQTVADVYREIGYYERSLPQQQLALEVRTRELGDDHPDTLQSASQMGALMRNMGKLDEAERYYLRVLEGRKRVLGANHELTLKTTNELGILYHSMSRLSDAEKYYRAAYEGRMRVFGEDHENTISSIANLGTLLRAQGKLDEAEPYLKKALEGFRKLRGNEHHQTLALVNNTGNLLRAMGRYSEAEPYFREALEGSRKVFGENHMYTLRSLGNLGALLYEMGRLDESEKIQREALEARLKALGPEHFDTLISMNGIAALSRTSGRISEARELSVQAFDECTRVLGPENLETHAAMQNLALVYLAEGRTEEAISMLRQVQADRVKSLGENHSETIRATSDLCLALTEAGLFEEAEELAHRAVASARANLPRSHRLRGVCLARHAVTLAQLGRFEEAQTEVLEAHELLDRVVGAGHFDTQEAVASAAEIYDLWHEAHPTGGFDAKADQWRTRIVAAPGE